MKNEDDIKKLFCFIKLGGATFLFLLLYFLLLIIAFLKPPSAYSPEKQYVVMINREKARSLGVREIVVKDVLPLWAIKKPDDEEVILISDTGIFPKEIIEKVYKITELNLVEQNLKGI